MNNFLSSLTKLDYYFNTRPSSGYFEMLLPMVIFFGITFIIATYFRFFYLSEHRREKHTTILGEKISSWLYYTSILGLLYLFMRYEGIVYLSARVIFYLIMIYFVVVGVRIWLYYQNEFIETHQEYQKNLHKTNYFPKKRKK